MLVADELNIESADLMRHDLAIMPMLTISLSMGVMAMMSWILTPYPYLFLCRRRF